MTLELINLHKSFGRHSAVDGLTATVEKGRILGMLGANGAGKTTTFRMILGLLDPTEGEALWEGRRLGYKKSHLIGYLPEERGLYPKLTVKEQLLYFMRLNRMKKADIMREMHQWLVRFQIEEYENKRVDELSKGNQQKIQFMAAVLHRPALLILDEPFSGLDPVNSDMLKKAVVDLQKSGTTIVFSSHQMANVEELCEDIVMLKKGRVVLQGDLDAIKRSYNMKSVVIKADYSLSFLEEIRGVIEVRYMKGEAKIKVADEKTAEKIFREVSSRGFARKFEVEEPSLHDIFVEIAGGVEDA